MSDQVGLFMTKFDAEAKKIKKEALDKPAFTRLFKEVMGGSTDDKTASMYFDGIDIDDSKEVSREEFQDFVKAALTKDQTYTVKMAFRAFDKDRSRALDGKEVKEIAAYVGKTLTDTEVGTAIERITGKKDGTLNYAQVVKLITNKEIKADTDPYDGKLKSGCCILV